MENKKCLRCGLLKSVSEFNKRTKTKDKLQSYCKECMRASIKPKGINGHILYEYGITKEEYKSMIDSQDGKCAICSSKPEKLFVDHDHYTGKIRALLCNKCNAGLGLFKDNSNFLLRAFKYILKHEKRIGIKSSGYSLRRSNRT